METSWRDKWRQLLESLTGHCKEVVICSLQVLKCTQELFNLVWLRYTDLEMVVITEVYIHRSLERGGRVYHIALHWEDQDGSGAGEEKA